MTKRGLTPKQQRFVDEYLVDLNASAAAARAAYSERSAGKIGFQLLEKTRIQEAVKRAKAERIERIKITQDEVLQELAKTGFADIKDYLSYRTEKVQVAIDDEGTPIFDYRHVIELKPSDKIDGAVVAEISQSDKGAFRFKLHDKIKALENIGRHLGMWNDKLQMVTTVSLEELVGDDDDE